MCFLQKNNRLPHLATKPPLWQITTMHACLFCVEITVLHTIRWQLFVDTFFCDLDLKCDLYVEMVQVGIDGI